VSWTLLGRWPPSPILRYGIFNLEHSVALYPGPCLTMAPHVSTRGSGSPGRALQAWPLGLASPGDAKSHLMGVEAQGGPFSLDLILTLYPGPCLTRAHQVLPDGGWGLQS